MADPTPDPEAPASPPASPGAQGGPAGPRRFPHRRRLARAAVVLAAAVCLSVVFPKPYRYARAFLTSGNLLASRYFIVSGTVVDDAARPLDEVRMNVMRRRFVKL